ncbi:phosphohydrolase [Candidatus Planktophila dulcis]|jgi:cytoskeletal protein RodZ|uniref:Phosphohydrolase n=1 Tax=Candidatus Planktophila dulcis TaxID=1884914 RepID=A0AAD0E555_9ACTN|nr:helix-turn-helix domain-containing protein [Candidatus Planktophila dulcis]ASY12199.1 phosphohydrolase [Candidatus Planktophila dulcis]
MTLGSTIRDAREAARISLESLSDSTSIRMGLLTEMEDNNFKHCGGDTYARGHLRNIANRIGLNPQILLDLYDDQHSTEKRAMQDLLVENNIMQVPREKKTISWKVPALISVTVLFVIASAQIITSNQSSSPAPAPTVSSSKSAAPAPTPSQSAATTESAAPAPAVTSKSGPVSLTLVASRGNSYIHIIVDGKTAEKGSMFQGETKSFTGKNVVSIYLSNPAGLDLTLNGKQLPPLGGQNEEVRRTFR